MAYFGETGLWFGELTKKYPGLVKRIVVFGVIITISALIAIFVI